MGRWVSTGALACLGAVLAVVTGVAGIVAATEVASYAATPTFPGAALTPGASALTPATVSSGTYVLPLPAGSDEYLTVPRTIPGSRIWFSLSAEIEQDAHQAQLIAVHSFVPGHEDQVCQSTDGTLSYGVGQPLQTGLWSSGTTAACRTSSAIELQITGDQLSAGSMQLVVWEEPPVPDTSTLPSPTSPTWTPLTAGDAQPLAAGTGLADTPLLPDGTWTVHVTAGSEALFRVPLTWGQHEQVEVTSTAQATRKNGYAEVQDRWLTPVGGVLPDTSYTQGGPSTQDLVLGDPEPAGWVTPTVAWLSGASGGQHTPAAFVGDYRLVIDTTGNAVPADLEVTLTAKTITDYSGRAPTYAAAPPDQPGLDGSSTAVPTGVPSAAGPLDGSGGSGRPWPLAGGLFAGSVVMAGAGAASLRVGRRQRALTRRNP